MPKVKKDEREIKDLFGISEERADEIINTFRHAQVDFDQWTTIFNTATKKIAPKSVAEGMFIGWTFAKMYDHSHSPSNFLRHLLSK